MGGWGNTKSVIRINSGIGIVDHDGNILNMNEFVTFKVTWTVSEVTEDSFKVFMLVNGELNLIMETGFKNAFPYDITDVSLSTGLGSTGNWQYSGKCPENYFLDDDASLNLPDGKVTCNYLSVLDPAKMEVITAHLANRRVTPYFKESGNKYRVFLEIVKYM